MERLIEDGELKDIERALLFTHIRVCASCKADLQRHRQLEVRLKETFAPIDTRPDFNQRVMAALPNMDYKPKIEQMPSAAGENVGRRTSKFERVTSRLPKLRWAYRWRTVIGVAACIGLGLLGVAFRMGFRLGQRDADQAPLVVELSGKAHVREGDKKINTLANERLLAPGDVLSADIPNSDFECWLNFGDAHLARVSLSNGAELAADNRHVYTLRSGSAHFDVQKNRPKGPDELFEVRIADSGIVRVRGTVFDIKNAGTSEAVVQVQEGHVEVQCGAAVNQLRDGEQIALGPGGFNGTVALTSLPPVKVPVSPGGRTLPVPPPPLLNVPPAVPDTVFDWERSVGPLSLSGLTLAEGLDALAAKINSPRAITELAQLARGPLIARDNRLTFSVRHAMPVRSVLAWMARDVSARFEVDQDGQGRLRLAAPEELPGPPENGAIPSEYRAALESPWERNGRAGARISVTTALDEVARACSLTIISDHVEAAMPLDNPARPAHFQNGARRLDAILSAAHLCAAWYDNVLYVAPAPRLEALTTLDRRSTPVSVLVGLPQSPTWSKNLLWMLNLRSAMPAQLPRSLGMPPSAELPGYWDVDPMLTGRAAFAGTWVADSNDGPILHYRAGIFGDAYVTALLNEIERGSQQVRGASGLTNMLQSVAIRDTNQLIELAKPFVPVESRLKNLAFNHQALAVRNLSLGRALEWGAWMQGCGIRPSTNGLVIDDAAQCYGAPSLQVLPLTPSAEHSAELAAKLPETFARLLPQLYPVSFATVEMKTVAGRLVFVGDKRQLQLAQELFQAFDQELGVAPAAENGERKLDLQTWVPASRRNLEKNLAEPFKGDGSGAVSGTFAGLLRQSGIGTQLRYTVLVDLAGMQQNHSKPIAALDVSQFSIGQYLDALARAAELKVVLEGDIILLTPAK